MNGLLLRRQLNTLDFLEFLDAALYLFRFGGLVAKSIDKRFELLNFILLIFVGRLELREPFSFLLPILFVTARVEMNLLVPNLDDLFHRHVEKIAIVRNEDIREFIIR